MQENIKNILHFPVEIQNQSTPNFKTPNNSFNNYNTPNSNGKNNQKFFNSDEKRGIERFRRVKEEEIEIDNRVVDNSFEAKVSVLGWSFLHTFFGREKEKKKEKLMENCWTTQFARW